MRFIRKPYGARYILTAVLLAGLLIGGFMRMEWRDHILSFLEWIEEQGMYAPLLFILIDAIIVALLLPGLLFTLGAGFIFGFALGGLYVIIGTTLGSALAFLVARRLIGVSYSRYFLQNHRLQLINSAFKRRGWVTILLTRLIPFFPFKLSNYFFGLTGYSLRDFLIGTFFGIMPFSLCNAYLGSITADLTMLGSERVDRSPLQWAFYGLGFIIILGLYLWATHIALKIYQKRIAEEDCTRQITHSKN